MPALVSKQKVIALIPARSGSKRLADKNILLLKKHPLIAYTIASALQSGIFSSVLVSTDSKRYADIARYYGAEVPFLRPTDLAGEHSMDIAWIKYSLDRLKHMNRFYDYFSILRPTSPFRLPGTIRRAWKEFSVKKGADSLRAVEKCKQHPGKMWVLKREWIEPLLKQDFREQPWHSSQYASLPLVYAQNASLEIARASVVFDTKSITGKKIIPFFTKAFEGFDINEPLDYEYAQGLVRRKKAKLPTIRLKPFGTRS